MAAPWDIKFVFEISAQKILLEKVSDNFSTLVQNTLNHSEAFMKFPEFLPEFFFVSNDFPEEEYNVFEGVSQPILTIFSSYIT